MPRLIGRYFVAGVTVEKVASSAQKDRAEVFVIRDS